MIKKRLIIGDIHGLGLWKDIYNLELPNDVIILGDYFDSFNLSSEVQYLNFLDLIECKKNHKGKFIMLLGNHDFHYIPGINEQYSGYNIRTENLIQDKLCDMFDSDDLPVVYIDYVNKIIFSHAGVSQKWFDKHIGTELSAINNSSISSLKFTYRDGGKCFGSSVYSSPIWIRPEGLIKNPYKDDIVWNQIYGHTHISAPKTLEYDDAKFINMDCLNSGYYMVQTLDDDVLINQEIKKLEI